MNKPAIPFAPSGAHAQDSSGGPHVVIVGGGASGVLMAAHLLSQPDAGFRVTILEGHNMLGCGVAYSTTDPDHLLNTRVHNMSAFADQPHHFQDWLQARNPAGGAVSPASFVSRATYGAYMSDLLRRFTSGEAGRQMRCLRVTCLRVEETADGVIAHLSDGAMLKADLAVLATGHVLPKAAAGSALTGAWGALGAVDPDQRIVIVGTGLSMVDQVLSLLKSGHRGEIVSISRRGLLPRSHAATRPLAVAAADVPVGVGMSRLLAWARALARLAEEQGGTWRDAVDGIRPHVRRIWRGLPQAERARFLRHLVTWWDVHRHRIPPESDGRISDAIRQGRLRLTRGAFVSGNRLADGRVEARVLLHGDAAPTTILAGGIIDCRGIRRDPVENASPLMADLLARGAARVDPLRIGLDVAADCRILDAAGAPSRRILAIGPVSRAAFWEITAIPDIREQVAEVARHLAEQPVV